MVVPAQLSPKVAQRRIGQPYVVVKDGLTLAIETLRMDMSLRKLFRDIPQDEERELTFRGLRLAVGLRRDREAIHDTIRSLQALITAVRETSPDLEPDEIFRACGLGPIKVLARPDGGSSNVVVDGAMRVMAAQEAGMTHVPVQLVAPAYNRHPTYGEPAPELLFVYFNGQHGQRLTTAECATTFRILAQRHREAHDDDRDAMAWAAWAAPQSGVHAATVYDAIKNIFQDRTDEQKTEAERRLREAAKKHGFVPTAVVNAIASDQGVTRTAVQKQAAELGLPLALPSVDAAPSAAAPAASDGDDEEAHAATALNLFASQIDKFDVRRNLSEIKALLADHVARLSGALGRINEWAEHEAAEYMVEQAKLLWSPLDTLWAGLLTFAWRARIYRDPHLARRDLARLKDMLAEAHHAVAGDRQSRARRRAAGRRTRG
jgi:hypothetical protein